MLIQLLVIQVIAFIALLFILRFFFSRNLNAALSRLNALHENNLIKEAELNKELKRAKEEREAEVKKGREEAAALRDEAKQEAAKARLAAQEEAKGEREKIIAQGEQEVKNLKERMVKEVQSQGVDLSLRMIKEVFTEKNKAELQHQFIREIINEVAQLPRENFPLLSGKVKVVSGYPLEEAQSQELKSVLEQKLGAPVNLAQECDKELISGLILQIGDLVIDGSIRNRLRRAIPFIKAA